MTLEEALDRWRRMGTKPFLGRLRSFLEPRIEANCWAVEERRTLPHDTSDLAWRLLSWGEGLLEGGPSPWYRGAVTIEDVEAVTDFAAELVLAHVDVEKFDTGAEQVPELTFGRSRDV